MDVSRIHPGRGMRNDNSMPVGFDLKQIFFTNLQLLGFDAAAMEIKYKIPFNKDMFNLPNKAGAEAVLYFLFNRLNPVMCRQEFRDCWPVSDKKTESTFRKICCIWLQNIQKEEADARLPRINASLFLSPGGDKFCHLLLAFSSYVMLHVIRKENGVKEDGVLGYPTLTSQNKEMGGVMETTVNCCTVRHRKQFFTTVEQMAYMKERWQHFADELTRKYRSLSKDVRSLEREKRDQVQKAAQGCVQRGSPVPADRMSHDFNMSAHTASRAQRVQQVRGLWKGVESFLERSKGEKEVVTAIIDRTLEKYTLDAANIQISIPHLMLLECEQEIRRRKVDNIYEGGQLNLVSVLQLWNLALEMYIRRLNRDGLKDLSQEAEMMKGQAHAHQAYLANASALREKMAAEVSVKKKSVAQLRRRFRADATLSGLSMSAPSPPVTFEPPQGHSGHTPTGPVLQMTPNQVDTPEAAIDIANSVSHSSRRYPIKPFHTSAFGVDMNQNKNWSNSNRLPRPVEKSGLPGSKASQQAARLLAGTKGKTEIQPRVIRHISRQSAAPPPSAHKKAPSSSSVKKTRASSSLQQASTPERKVAPSSRQNDVDKTPVPAGASSNAVETPRQRAHNILADKIVWAVMHGSEDEEISSHHYGLSPAHPSSASKPSVLPSSAIDLSHFQSLSLPTTASPSMPWSARPKTTQARAPTVQDTSQGTVDAAYSPAAGRQRHRSDTAGDMSRFGVATSPVTLVQQARLRQDSDSGDESEGGGGDAGRAARTQGDGGELEVDDVNVQDPIAALSEEAFITHDLIHRSPLAFDIRRMWKDAISDDAGEGDDADSKHHTADWPDSDRSSAGSARVLTPTIPQSPASSDTSPSPRRLQPSSVVVHTHTPSALENKRSTNDIRASGGGHAKPYVQRVQERPVESSQTVMINNTMTFYTSFDEDSLQGSPDREAEDSPVEWEERLSALYDDSDHPETDASEGKGDRNTNDLAFNSALDTLFQAKSPQRAAGVGESAVEDGATPVRKVDSPLIFFTPHQPAPCSLGQGSEVQLKHVTPALSQKASHDVASHEDRAGLTDRAPPPATQRGVQGPWRGATDGAGMSPETASDKENHGSLTSQDKRYGFNQASGKNGSDSVTTTPVKKVTFSPSKPSSNAGHTQVEEGLWRGDDLTNVSGTSPLNDSFTPLQSGLFLQGKSPSRPSLEQVWSDQRGQTSSSSAVPSFMDTVNLDNLDQSLVAQLRRLQQVKAEAFSHPAPGGDGERKEEEAEGADGGATLSWPVTVHRPATVGEEEELPMSAAKPWGILDEDDSVLLPSSP